MSVSQKGKIPTHCPHHTSFFLLTYIFLVVVAVSSIPLKPKVVEKKPPAIVANKKLPAQPSVQQKTGINFSLSFSPPSHEYKNIFSPIPKEITEQDDSAMFEDQPQEEAIFGKRPKEEPLQEICFGDGNNDKELIKVGAGEEGEEEEDDMNNIPLR